MIWSSRAPVSRSLPSTSVQCSKSKLVVSSDLLKDADSLSFFEVNMPLYYQREGWEETKRRCIWGYGRLSARMEEVAKRITYEDEGLTRLLKEAIREAGLKDLMEKKASQ